MAFEKAFLGLAFASRMDSHTLALHTVWYLGVHGIPSARTGGTENPGGGPFGHGGMGERRMPRKSTLKLSRRVVEALAVERGDRVFYDRDLTGFGVRVHARGRKVYVVHARAPGGALKRAAIGRKVDITVEDARRVAAEVIDRLKKGEEAFPEPPAPEPTVADLAERYVEAHLEVNCRPGTVETFGRILRLYILPEFGHMPLPAVERGHVAALHHKMRDKPYQANQTRDVLAKMFRLAAAWGMTPPRRNPALSIRRYKEYRRERFLSADEYLRLARVLDEAEADGSVFPTAIPAIRLLILTGCRKNEIVTLRWDDIDRTAGELLLRDSKTGPRVVPLSPGAARVLADLPRDAGNPWVIAGRKPGSRLSHIVYYWYRVRERAELDDVRIHDLRHSFASRALALGESLPTIGKLLGHSKIQTTARYAHLARDSVQESAARVAASIGADILP